MSKNTVDPQQYIIKNEPYYEPVADEVTVFEAAYANGLPVLRGILTETLGQIGGHQHPIIGGNAEESQETHPGRSHMKVKDALHVPHGGFGGSIRESEVEPDDEPDR